MRYCVYLLLEALVELPLRVAGTILIAVQDPFRKIMLEVLLHFSQRSLIIVMELN